VRNYYIWRNKLKEYLYRLQGLKSVEWDVSNPMQSGDIRYILHAVFNIFVRGTQHIIDGKMITRRSLMYCCAVWQIHTDDSEQPGTYIFAEENQFHWNVGIHRPIRTASH
jgi:hypothetical protein